MQKSVGEVRWWQRRRPIYLATTFVVTAGLAAAGWFTGLRDVFHGAALSIAIVALLPFLVIGIGLVLLLSLVAVASLTESDAALEPAADGGLAVVGAGAGMVRPYYRTLHRLRRHPVIWGVCSGAVLGCAVLGLALALVVIPAEMETADTLAHAQHEIDAHYAKRGSFPRPGPNGTLTLDGDRGPLRDAFGHPLAYRVSGHWKVASYRLSSRGFDGEEGTSDDLCVKGATKAVEMVETVLDLRDRLARLRSREASRGERLESIRALRCGDD
jgi:hypothetical protein